MTARELLDRLHARGFKLRPAPGKVLYHPKSKMTPELLAAIKQHKPELLALLRGAALPSASTPEPVVEPEQSDGDLIPLGNLEPCRKCGSLELWQSVGGQWHCQKCNPPKAWPSAHKPRPKPQAGQCRCGSDRFADIPIHGGESTRRDCAQCGRFLAFVQWYGNTTNAQN